MDPLTVMLIVELLIVGIFYVWISLAAVTFFKKTGSDTWKGWVPIVREWELFKLAGMKPYWIVILIIGGFVVSAIATIIGYFALANAIVMSFSNDPDVFTIIMSSLGLVSLILLLTAGFSIFAIIIQTRMVHRINQQMGLGVGYTVLGFFFYPIWLSVVAWGSALWRGRAPVSTVATPAALPVQGQYAQRPMQPPAPVQPPMQQATMQQPPMQHSSPQPVQMPQPPVQQGQPMQPILPIPVAPVEPPVAPVQAAPVIAPPVAPPVSAAPPAPQIATPPANVWQPPSAPASPAAPATPTPVAPPATQAAPAPAPASTAAPVTQTPAAPPVVIEEVEEHTVLAKRKKKVTSLKLPTGETVEIVNDVVFIGRDPVARATDPGAQLVPVDEPTKTVSKTHARLKLKDGVWHLQDLRSTNGVYKVDADGNEEEVKGEVVASAKFMLGDAPFEFDA